MKISFHGAARTVTGSKHLITLDNGKKLLLDCGLFQGMGDKTEALNESFGFDAREVNYMVLSHAHIDHCGLLPKLIKDGYKGKVYATPATKDLASILMEDSAGIQEGDARMTNKRLTLQKLPLVTPLYTTLDAMAAAERFETVEYDTWFVIDENIECSFTEAGHIIGSAAVHLRITENGKKTCITFSGDVGRYKDMILRAPAAFEQADYILLESTYGNSLHEEHAPNTELMLQWIQKTCIEKKGKLIMPAFSVGRTQEILYSLNQLSVENKLPPIDIFVDSPLSMEATDVIRNHTKYFNESIQALMKVDKDPFDFPGLTFLKTQDESKQLNYRREPCVIISSSGMAEAGRVKHHIANNIGNSRNSILLTGYCAPGSLGGRLKNGEREVRIFGKWHEVNAEVGQVRSMSAHGDYEDLLHFLACQDAGKVKNVFLVHGEYDVQQDFKEKLIGKGFANIIIPDMHTEIGLK
jgi:metallo-beta-lactamase family protein